MAHRLTRWSARTPASVLRQRKNERSERTRTKPTPQTAASGFDIGKKVFHVVALNADEAVIQRAKVSRNTLMAFFDAATKVLIGIGACLGSQWLVPRLTAMGHDAGTCLRAS